MDDNQLLTALQRYENENIIANDDVNAQSNNEEEYVPFNDTQLIAAARMFLTR